MAQKRRKVFLYTIHHRDDSGYGSDAFEAILADIMRLSVNKRSWQYTPDNDSAFIRLVKFEKLHKTSQTSQVYAGVVAAYDSNTITVGEQDKDSVWQYQLPDGRLPLQVVHFLYYADTKHMVLEYNRNAASNVKIMAYVNTMVQQLQLSHKLAFMAEVICHPSAVEYIKRARRIKSVSITVPRDAVQSNSMIKQLAEDIFTAPSIEGHTDTLGSITIEFKPKRGQFLSSGAAIDTYLKEFPDIEKQVYTIEAEEGMELTTVNLMQPQFKNEIQLPDATMPQAAYDAAVFTGLHNVYKASKDVING